MRESLSSYFKQHLKKENKIVQHEIRQISDEQEQVMIEHIAKICPPDFPIGKGLRGGFDLKMVAQYQPEQCVTILGKAFVIPKAGKVSLQIEQQDTHRTDGRKEYIFEVTDRSVFVASSGSATELVVITEVPEGLPSDPFARTYVFITNDALRTILESHQSISSVI